MGSRGPLPKNPPSLSFRPGVPPPPPSLTPEAKREYKRIAREFAVDRPGHLQMPDGAVLAAYATAFTDALRYQRELEKIGSETYTNNGVIRPHPLAPMRIQAWKLAVDAAAKLGFSPADRARVSTQPTRDGRPSPLDGFVSDSTHSSAHP
jgi:P27 family predicted phage terminase small subunit